MGGGNTPSGDITIDDVVKFIHDNWDSSAVMQFPYTTWDSIPNYQDANTNDICKTNIIIPIISLDPIIFNMPGYVIGVKQTNAPVG